MDQSLQFFVCYPATRTGMAVEHVRDELFKVANGNRNKAQDVMIVFTDGVAADGNVLKAAAQELRDRGVKVSEQFDVLQVCEFALKIYSKHKALRKVNLSVLLYV